MTCIVALKGDDNRVYLGGDSLDEDHRGVVSVRKDKKIFKLNAMGIGFTTSWRMGQIIRHHASGLDPYTDEDEYDIVASVFVEQIRDLFDQYGWKTIENGIEYGGVFLIAYRGRIFHVDDDFSVGEPELEYWSVGSGSRFALGSLHTTSTLSMNPKERVIRAIEAASCFSSSCGGPISTIEVF